MLELLKDCRQKEIYCAHNDVEDLIESALNSKLLSIKSKSQRLVQEKQEESIIPLNNTPQISPVNAITHDLPSECDLPVNDESSLTFTTFSNPLFDSNDDVSSSDDESLSNEDFDYLLAEFSGELTYIDLIPQGIPLSPPPIPVEDNDSLIEEIDLFLGSDDSMPSGIKNDDYDSKGDIRFLEELLSNDSPPLPENKSSNLDHVNDPSSPRPPPKPSNDDIFETEPDTGVLTANPLHHLGIPYPNHYRLTFIFLHT
ncbi:hypothetical protein Tco_1456362 [Tanacetum coccineum]